MIVLQFFSVYVVMLKISFDTQWEESFQVNIILFLLFFCTTLIKCFTSIYRQGNLIQDVGSIIWSQKFKFISNFMVVFILFLYACFYQGTNGQGVICLQVFFIVFQSFSLVSEVKIFESLLNMQGIGLSPSYVLFKMFLNIIIMCHTIACIIRGTAKIQIQLLDEQYSWV